MEFKEGLTVGIDLGTTFSSVAILNDEGVPNPVQDEEGEEGTPSVILLVKSGRAVVGANLVRAAMEDPTRVVACVKRNMGETTEEFKQTFDGKRVTPEFFSGLILKKLREHAEKTLGPIGNAVVTVPYHFNDRRRKATQDAAKVAGLNVIDIINEPTAATLTYAWMHGQLGAGGEGQETLRKVLVYDLGGGTFDVTVVQYTPTHIQVLATDGDVHLGGVDWNDRLVDYVAEQFAAEHGEDPRESEAAVHLLRYQCDLAKIALSDQVEAEVRCTFRQKSSTVRVTRKKFEEITAELVQRTVDTVHLVLEQAGVTADELDTVVLVGGSTLMPMISERLESEFQFKLYRDLSPYKAVAQGAAIHAAILEAKYRGADSTLSERLRARLASVEQIEVNSHGLGVVILDQATKKPANYVMIPRNTRIPAEKRKSFVTVKDGQRRIRVQVIQGEAPDPAACDQIGEFVVTDLPSGLPKGSPVEVVYSFDNNGRIHVHAEDKTGGAIETAHIERAGALSVENIDALSHLVNEYHLD